MKCDASALKKDDSHAGSNPSLFKDLSGTKVLSKTHKHGRSGYPGHMTRVQQRGGGEPIPADSRGRCGGENMEGKKTAIYTVNE